MRSSLDSLSQDFHFGPRAVTVWTRAAPKSGAFSCHWGPLVTKVFGNAFGSRCTFTGQRSQKAKCDFSIPACSDPRILIEAKGYGATGSKMTDVIGDIQAIIDAKRADTTFLLFTDGVTWRQRQSDLRKIIDYHRTTATSRASTPTRWLSVLRTTFASFRTEYRL